MYTLVDYGSMMADAIRVPAYAKALRSGIQPGAVVVEIGTGIGAFAVMAVKMGASLVIAIEPSDAITVARLIAEENGVSDRIDFIQALARDVTLAVPADLLIADLRGALPVATTYLESMIDARDRLLKPGGVLIPAVDTLCAAVVETPTLYWKRRPSCNFEGAAVSLSALQRFTTNAWGKARFREDELLTDSVAWAQIDYRTITSPSVEGAASCVVRRNGVGHGLAVWFDAMLAEGVHLSNAPRQPQTVWGTSFFPWSEPVDLVEGDQVQIRIEARYASSDYTWRWDADVVSPTRVSKARFRQSSFHSEPFVPSKLKKGAGPTVPTLSDDGRIERFILDAMDGTSSNHDIAGRLTAVFPGSFDRPSVALARVGEVAQRFSR